MPTLLPFLLVLGFITFQDATTAMPEPESRLEAGATNAYAARRQETTQAASGPHAPYKDSHEGMTIGVDPWTTASRYKQKFSKKSPFSGGIVALQVSFRNDNDKGVRVNLQRIRLIVQLDEDNRQELQPLGPEDVADTVLLKPAPADPTKRRLPLPIPTTKPKPHRDANWTKLRDDCQNAAVPSGVVGGHGTVEGLIYFDLRGEVDVLQNARLYVPNLTMMDSNEPISFFEIDLGHSSTGGQ